MKELPRGAGLAIRIGLTVAIVAAVGVFAARALVRDWGAIDWSALDLRVGYLAVGLAATLGVQCAMALGWKTILRALGERLSFVDALRITFVAGLAKYLPGKLWVLTGRVMMAGAKGLSRARVLTSLILEVALVLLSGLLIAAVVIALGSERLPAQVSVPMLAAGALGLVVACHPRILDWGLNLGLRLVRREAVRIDLPESRILALLALYTVLWGLYGVALWLLANGVVPVDLAYAPRLLAYYCLSFVAGTFAVFAPAGLGVREGIFALCLAPTLTMPVALVVAVVARVGLSGMQIVAAGLGAALARWEGCRAGRPCLAGGGEPHA